MTDPASDSQSNDVEAITTAADQQLATSRVDPNGLQGAPDSANSQTMDLDSFRETYEKEFGYVWNVLRRFGVRQSELEDAAHELFVVLYRQFYKYDPSRPLRPWLAGIAFRVASDFRRKAYRQREQATADTHEFQSTYDADKTVEEKRRKEALYHALSEVDEDRRVIIMLHDLEGYAMPVVAEALEVPLNTCYSRLRLGRQDLARLLKEHMSGKMHTLIREEET
jgi:RNA polymerase sigma-70 factor, ECF subfamily